MIEPAALAAKFAKPTAAIPAAELQPLAANSSCSVSGAPGADRSFATVLKGLVQEVNQKQVAAGESVQALQSGQNVPLHQTMIAIEEANLSFQLMVEVRNKLLESYQEIMRMQV
jgi:flagellar hook-basal body complex protein FliE